MKSSPDKRKLGSLSINSIYLAPSILAADFANLANDISSAEDAGIDMFHIDIMDGHFVPNLSIGPGVVQAIRPRSNLPFDVHLMLDNPLSFVKPFADAGTDHITFHCESNDAIIDTIKAIRKTGCSVGISLKPDTDASEIFPYLDVVDLVLVMTVEPGFGGQKFRHDMLPKIKIIQNYIREKQFNVHIQVDGGIDIETGKQVVNAGANILVAGTSIFKNKNGLKNAVLEFKNSLFQI